ncbi:hypothetical protein FB562_0828 [Homoserinimonas aerilata]|uniref:Uncharacterized protein n=1 Tax=Homoserinimonas aerilata TaxID=1162970 RepID=A0A542YI74_9MICO|nr:hypothetical protein [Homoserinimonas aerilata]TQL47758.1 hypothetical protein FB562_0828 [Homoserinimonas aerilata]
MQLGTRWTVGADAPAALPEAVVAAVREVEAELAAIDEPGFDPSQWRWTLTWLEGRPVVELDDGTRITYDPTSGTASVTAPE